MSASIISYCAPSSWTSLTQTDRRCLQYRTSTRHLTMGRSHWTVFVGTSWAQLTCYYTSYRGSRLTRSPLAHMMVAFDSSLPTARLTDDARPSNLAPAVEGFVERRSRLCRYCSWMVSTRFSWYVLSTLTDGSASNASFFLDSGRCRPLGVGLSSRRFRDGHSG